MVEPIHQVGLVVKEREEAERFQVGVLRLNPVPDRPRSKPNATNAIHLIPPGTGEDEHSHHRPRHVSLQVADLRAVLLLLLDRGLRVFQAGFDGAETQATNRDDPMDFGTAPCSFMSLPSRAATERA